MMTDTELKLKGLRVLTEALGAVQAEKFVALILREPFDYTQWRRRLWPDKTVEEISADAMKGRKGSAGQRKGPRRRSRPRRNR